MADPNDATGTTRRRFIVGAAGLAAGSTVDARADNAKNLPPNIADWTRQLGEGVGVRPYGNPSKYEKDVIRRTVPWLTATPEIIGEFHAFAPTGRNHYPQRALL